MLANGACHLGNDVFAGGMSDVSDTLYVILARQAEELPLARAVQWEFEEDEPASPKSTTLAKSAPQPPATKSHSAFGSPDGRLALFLNPGGRNHYLVDTKDGSVTIFETRHAALSVAWHPMMGDVLFLLLANGDVDVFLASKPIAGSALTIITTIQALKLVHGMFAVLAPNPNPDASSINANTSSTHGKSVSRSASVLHTRKEDSFLPTHSQLLVLNSFNNTAVSGFVSMAFLPPVVGQPLLLALATATGDVYAIKLNKSCEPEGLSRDTFADELDDVFGDSNFASSTLPAAPAYVRLLISTPLSSNPLSRALTLNAYMIDVRQGRVAIALLHEDGKVRVYYLWPNDLIRSMPKADTEPARVACDHELVLCEAIAMAGTKSPAAADPSMLVAAHQAGNVILYRVEDEIFLLVLPIWLRRQHVWALRYANECHRGEATLMPLSSTADLAPAPLAIRVPLVASTYSTAIGTNDLLMLPKSLASGSQPILIALDQLMATAMMAMHRKGVRMLTNTSNAANSSTSPAKKALTSSTSAPTALQTAIGVVANACASFYKDMEDGTKIDREVLNAEELLTEIRDTLVAKEAQSNIPKLSALRSSLADTERRQATVITNYQQMQDAATNAEMHSHGVSALVEVNKMLGEIHQRLNKLEAAHANDAAIAEKAIGVSREVRRTGTISYEAQQLTIQSAKPMPVPSLE